MNLNGKRFLIVGASSGLGRELAIQLLARDCSVVTFSRKADRLREDLAVYSHISRLTVVRGDLRNPEDISNLARKVREGPKPLDGIIHVAGVSRPDLVEKPDVNRSIDTLKVNLEGPIRIIYEFLPDLIDREGTLIAGFTSMAGMRGMPRAHAYSASKAGFDRFLESLRIDLWDRKTRVFTIVPGYVETPMTSQNSFPMPGIWPVGKAVSYVLKSMARDDLIIRFPWYHALSMLIARHLPTRLYCWLMNRQKPGIHIRPHPEDEFSW